MIYRGPGLLVVIYGLAPRLSPHPLLSSESCLSFSVFLCVAGRVTGEVRAGEGDKACDGEKVCSTNRSILSGRYTLRQRHFDITVYSIIRASKVHIQYIGLSCLTVLERHFGIFENKNYG